MTGICHQVGLHRSGITEVRQLVLVAIRENVTGGFSCMNH